MSLDAEIADAFRQLNEQLQVSDPRSKRDAAQMCCQQLESLKVVATDQELTLLEVACERARCTFDALHQELQYTLEWAGSAMVD